MRPRVTISIPGDDASDANAEKVPNQIKPESQRVLAPVAVTERPRGEQQAREHDRVRVHDPLEIGARSRRGCRTMVGSATLSTVLSIPITTTHSDSTHNVHQRRDETGSVEIVYSTRSSTGSYPRANQLSS